MANLENIKPKQSIEISFEEDNVEFAFVTWLNLLVTEARINGLIFSKFELEKNNSHWKGRAWGEPWREELEHGTEVKGATLTMLSVTRKNKHWEARCVVDV